MENAFFKKYTKREKKEAMMEKNAETLARNASKKALTSTPPGQMYDSVNFCHHFGVQDHIELGRDLGMVLYKVLIKTDDNMIKVQQVQS